MGVTISVEAEPLLTGNVFHRGNLIFGLGGKMFVNFISDRLWAVKHNIFVLGIALCAKA